MITRVDGTKVSNTLKGLKLRQSSVEGDPTILGKSLKCMLILTLNICELHHAMMTGYSLFKLK